MLTSVIKTNLISGEFHDILTWNRASHKYSFSVVLIISIIVKYINKKKKKIKINNAK